MGIESQYLGEINIPEEHRAEYAQQALKLLRAGGMVTVEPVQLYGHKLYLLSLPELDEEGKAVGHYNYLDENGGERWCLNAKEGWFGCGKIIGSCYYSTIAAVHILTTLWSTSYAATLIDGCLVREKLYIRWINYVLGTQYTNHRATQLWEIGKLLQLDNGYWVHRNPDLGYLLEDYPPECADRDQTLAYLAAYHFDELCSILPPLTDEDWEELKQSKMLTIQAIYDQLQSTLREYHQNGGTLEGVKKFLIMLTEEKRQMIHQYLAIDSAMHAGFYEGQGSIGHETGTRVRIRCPKSKLEGLKPATRRTQVNFRQLMAYLEEETSYTYAPLLASGEIKISIQVGDEEMPRRLAALEPAWDGTPALVPEFVTDLGGGPVTIRCRYGTIQSDKKTAIYYKGNMASSGLEIRFNGRCIEHGLYASVYGKALHPSCNRFLCQIDLLSEDGRGLPATESTKNACVEEDCRTQALFRWIRANVKQPETMRESLESRLVGQLAEKKRGEEDTYRSIGLKGKIDLLVSKHGGVQIYEAKAKGTKAEDLYQLRLYTDGCSMDEMPPRESILIGERHPKEVESLMPSAIPPDCPTISPCGHGGRRGSPRDPLSHH